MCYLCPLPRQYHAPARARHRLCTSAVQRHGPRRIAQHPEQSGPLPLPALTHQSPEIGKGKNKFSFSLGFHYISRLAAANIGCASEE